MTLRSKLLARFRDGGYRRAYVESFLDAYIATQIKVLRERRDLSQTRLAEKANMKQSQISEMEDVNHTSWKISTLKKIAKGFDLALVVRFESFSGVLPDIERFGREALQRASFDDDPLFSERGVPPVLQDGALALSTRTQVASAGARILQFHQVRQGMVCTETAAGSALPGGGDSTTVGLRTLGQAVAR
jgi:transcriptional regulator with XRE-family HTH domain